MQRDSVIHARFNNLIENMLSTTYTVLPYIVRKTLKKYIWNDQLEFQKLYNDPSPYTVFCSKCPAFIFHQEQKINNPSKSSSPLWRLVIIKTLETPAFVVRLGKQPVK